MLPHNDHYVAITHFSDSYEQAVMLVRLDYAI